jgi:hypothetical protein
MQGLVPIRFLLSKAAVAAKVKIDDTLLPEDSAAKDR